MFFMEKSEQLLWQKAKIIDDVKVAVCPECGNIEMYLEDLTNLKD